MSRREYLLQDFELKFSHQIPFKDAAMACIEPSEGSSVPGVIYTISKIDELRLDCMESHIVFNRHGKHRVDDGPGGGVIFLLQIKSVSSRAETT